MIDQMTQTITFLGNESLKEVRQGVQKALREKSQIILGKGQILSEIVVKVCTIPEFNGFDVYETEAIIGEIVQEPPI
ncbi:MAG: hypothetical protein COV96_00730 [Candidatus Zambryskibacteria bacterium CG11_big_fil_rev_8_21_14_0_20_42_18]|uniref:Uncharacterized protein n=1 Tax=Candidatus Zambryskibacteria bacterium CG_4_9_14_3_um_filter_42_15 TaxID=1975112 RepID=A0A2M7WR82_9BACT|nr:MAG: hypothetical protein COV96_00730 [Candidatus Zambryskibacteria bacterium CG11_big_fil_rev_8_21_14_0_20_42_18]PJA32510.1 MAG: hypothetical protein CO185_02635 [Candidatus Zambryskibacteria bacterium CG_4_9_14_3_um_filter_42_15]